jgi:hypothetical protein
VGKRERKRPLGRPRDRWVSNSIKMDLEEAVWAGVDSIFLVQDRGQRKALVNAAMNSRVLLNFGSLQWPIL